METLKSVGGCLLYIVILAACVALAALFFLGAAWCSTHLLPWFMLGSEIAASILFLILLPLCLIRKVRGFAAIAILLISYVFGITVWMEGLLITLSTWGVGAVIFGLLFAGVGVVPIAMLAALFHGMWWELLDLTVLTALTFGCRFFSIWIAEKN
jgi:hypothetical protein